MEKYKVVFLQSALDDLEEIVLYIAKDSKKNAMKMHDKIIETANRLETFPKLGLLVPDKKLGESGFRMIAINKYLLFYKVYPEEVDILRVLHGARDCPKLLSRFSSKDETGR